MRDEFSNGTKDLLAKRVGFKCSNPTCQQPTSGPQADPSGAINVGVAAHITAASADGPRYNPSLTSNRRRAGDNGIWLCQIDAKLVDNDTLRYTADTLTAWKAQAEDAATHALEHRLNPDADSIFARLAKLMPALLAEMRQDLSAQPLGREFVVMKRSQSYWAKGDELFYYYDDHSDLIDKLRILENEGLVKEITYNNATRYLLSERLSQYLGAP